MKSRVKPPANYFGGKFGTIGGYIAQILPEHKFYVEPFGGMAGVMFHKSPSLVEVYNDIDRRLFNLFCVLQSKKSAKELIELLKLTPFGRDSYLAAHKVLKEPGWSDVRIAWATLVALGQGIQPSMRHNGFRNGGAKYETSVARLWKKRNLNLTAVTERISDWIIENQSAEKIMLRYNTPDAVIFCDPPYVHSTRNRNAQVKTIRDYAAEMTDVEHELFLIVCRHLKSRVIISGYDNELYNTLLADWHRQEINVISAMAAALPNADDGHRTEVIWANFPIKQQLQIF